MLYLGVLEWSLVGRAGLVREHRGGRGDVKTTLVDMVTVRLAGSCCRGPGGVRGIRVGGLGTHRQTAVETAVDVAVDVAVDEAVDAAPDAAAAP